MNSIIRNLIDNQTLTQLNAVMYKCICGSEFKKSSVYTHLKTSKHKLFMTYRPLQQNNGRETEEARREDGQECGICYTNKIRFYKCSNCRNTHCMDCHTHIEKCPFCRTVIHKWTVQYARFLNTLTRKYEQFKNKTGTDRINALHNLYNYIIKNIDLLKNSLFKDIRQNILRDIMEEFTKNTRVYGEHIIYIYTEFIQH
jgi:hypothetical protein